MIQYIDKSVLVTEIERLISEIYGGQSFDSLSREKQVALWYIKSIMSSIYTLEVKEVDLKPKSFVKIDRKVLFEICDAILNHDGYSDVNDCLENDSECFWGKWDEGFRKKVENIRRNS